MITQEVWNGVASLLDNYIGIRDSDMVVVGYTPDSREPAAWVAAALDFRGINNTNVWMSALRDDGFLERFSSALPKPDKLMGRLIVLTLERDTMSHNSIIRNALSDFDPERCFVFRAISACPDLFSHALRTSPQELSAKNTALLDRFVSAKKLRITTAKGTKLNLTLDNDRHRWVSNRGVWRSGNFVMLPAGEVATYPARIDGVFVADFAFNVNAITEIDARLHEHPVTIWIEEGRAVRYACDNPIIQRFIEQCLRTDCAPNVGELGFGTNVGLDSSISLNSHINERRPGVHLGFGDHNQADGVVGYECPIHLDLIAKGGLVWTDDDPIPMDLENVPSSEKPHPIRYHAEDLRSPGFDDLEIDDCCGILTRDGLQLFQGIERA